jgi:hypothetical protein
VKIAALAAIASASVVAAAAVKTGVRVSRRAAWRSSCAIMSMIPAFGAASHRWRARRMRAARPHRSVNARVRRPALSRHAHLCRAPSPRRARRGETVGQCFFHRRAVLPAQRLGT